MEGTRETEEGANCPCRACCAFCSREKIEGSNILLEKRLEGGDGEKRLSPLCGEKMEGCSIAVGLGEI